MIGTLLQNQWSFGHGGGNSAGMSTSVDLYPETDWVVVVLGNYPDRTTMLISDLARKLIVAA